IIGHIHTKQSLHVSDRAAVDEWRHFLLRNMLGGSIGNAMADAILLAMASDPSLGVAFPDDPKPLGWDTNLACAQLLAPSLGIQQLPEQFNFPTGTMFWMRADALKPFVELGLD